jgi:predicted AAA+ superfamily ATPase
MKGNKLEIFPSMKPIIKSAIRDFHEKIPLKLFSREIEIPINSGKIITLIGARRTGKTYLLYQIANQVAEKFGKEKILYLNFEDERFQWSTEDLHKVLDSWLELYPNTNWNEVYFFFDEIQLVDKWEQFTNRIYENYSKNVFITGSSAKLLSKEIATTLRGRTISYEVYPYSFKEFVQVKHGHIPDINLSKSKAILTTLLEDYLFKGGYPEIVSQKNEEISIKTLQSYAEVMMYRDIIDRYKITQIDVLKYFIQRCVNNTAKEFSVNRVYNDIKSKGHRIGKDTLYTFPKYLEDVFFIFFPEPYNPSLVKRKQGSPKTYLLDNGLINALTFRYSKDYGRLMENLIYIELKRRGKNVFLHKSDVECDFIIHQGMEICEAIQVTTDLEEDKTRNREIKGVLSALNTYDLDHGLLLNYEEEQLLEINGKTIQFEPIWKWLLR